MSILSKTYRPLAWIEAPVFETATLWGLGIFFAILGLLYFFLIFYLRNRISRRNKYILLQKRNLAPMISNFLFFDQEQDITLREDYIRMKIEIREQLRYPKNRKVMVEVLMDLRQDLSGQARERLLNLYQDLGLQADAFKKLKSWRWEQVSQGILELTEMRVDMAYTVIRKFINDRRSVIRKQAQLASVKLQREGITYFLDTARYRISEWQQLKLLEVLRSQEDYDPPRFKAWLTSENKDVVLFALRLIRHYRQNDAEAAIVTLLRHKRRSVQIAAIDCIKEFGFTSAREPLKQMFERSGEELKVAVLDAIWHIGVEDDMEFLTRAAHADRSFIVRSKAKAVMNNIQPDSALPTANLQPEFPKAQDADSTAVAPEPENNESETDPVHPIAGDISASMGQDEPAGTPEVSMESTLEEVAHTTLDQHHEGPEPDSLKALPTRDKAGESLGSSGNEELDMNVEQLDLSCDFSPFETETSRAETPTDEELALFDLCLWQELASILDLAKSNPDPGKSARFLPVVVAQNPAPIPDAQWLFELEVEVEEIRCTGPEPSASSGPPSQSAPDGPTTANDPIVHPSKEGARDTDKALENVETPGDTSGFHSWIFDLPVIAEILLAPLSDAWTNPKPPAATKPLTPEIIPKIMDPTPSADKGATTPLEQEERSQPTPSGSCGVSSFTPLFDLAEAPIDQIGHGSGKASASRKERVDNAQVFSIFREFFGHYDTESKLIMMDQIPAVGGEKEWEFLKSLQQDPEPAVRERAAFLANQLAKRLWGESGVPVRSPKVQKPIEGLNFVPAWAEEEAETEKDSGASGPQKQQGSWWPFNFLKLNHE